jgi:hypothetical protein
MKTPKWEKGNRGSCGSYPPKNGKMLLPGDPVKIGMDVSAKCKGENVRLKIIEETEPEIFKAEVIGEYFLNEPEELNYGDEVFISREFALFISEK